MKYELDSIDESVVTLDTYNSDLNLVIDASKYTAHSLTKEGFAFMWAGARATHGIAKGKACFEVKVIEQLDVSHLPSDEPNPHVVRVGFSVDSSTMQLGEDPLSYGYGGTGKISTNCQFKDFGPPFQAGDCILAVVDMVSDPIQIGFAKNGAFIGWAYKVRRSELQDKALFPHILTKNCSFEVNFGQRGEPFHKLPEVARDFTFIGCLPVDQRVGGTRPPAKREDCEMIMMCGLPGAGKSVWAADYSLKNPDKKYNVLGTNNIIDKMKVMGLPRKRNYAGRWDVLIQMATKCLNTMFAIGSKLRRNYILDQTNVYPTAQRRKMRNFDGFRRVAVVVVPTDTEYKRRCDKRDREEGKEIPDSAILEMKANFKLPEIDDIFNDIIFTELQRDEAEKLVKVYNEEGKACLGPAKKQFRPNEPDRKGNLGFNRNDSFDSRGNRGNFGNFQGDQGMRGPNPYGGGRGGFNNRGGFNGGRGGGYDSYGGRDYNDGRGGFGDRGGYDSPPGFGGGYDSKEGFDRPYGGGRGGYDNGRNSGRGGYEGSRGGRGGFDGNRGGSRGGYDGNRGGYDGSRGGYDSNRGGYDNNRGGYDNNRSGYEGNRGGGRGGFDNNRGRGGYNGNRGGGRGGYDGNRGGGRGGYDGNRSGGRGGYDSNRGGGRGGYDGNRGNRNDYDGRGGARSDNYDNRSDSYGSMYGGPVRDGGGSNYSSGYGSDRGYDKTSGDLYRSSYDAADSVSGAGYGYSDYGSDSYSGDKFSNQSYGNSSSNDYKRGSANPRYQQGNRGTTSRGGSRGSFQNDSYSRDGTYSSSYSTTGESADVQSSYSDGSYGYGTGSYDYKSPSTDSYTSRDTQSSYTTGTAAVKTEPSQRYSGSSSNTGSKYNQGTGFSGTSTRVSRWSAEVVPQTPAVATPPADTYSSTRSQSYDYPKSDTSATAYQAKQSYGYQQGLATNIAAQPAAASSVTTTANPGGYADWQAQWMQYGQQMPNQYYSQ